MKDFLEDDIVPIDERENSIPFANAAEIFW
jgi:hypothetical protein